MHILETSVFKDNCMADDCQEETRNILNNVRI